MRIYIAHDDDTLRSIARKNDIELTELISINPHITDPDAIIACRQVKLPAHVKSADKKMHIPAYPFPNTRYQSDEQWVPLTSLEEMEQTDYDVLIVGSGAGGGAVLWRLCEQWRDNGKRIGIVEAGDLLVPTNVQNIATMDPERIRPYKRSLANPPPNYDFQQVIALGGRTLFWFGVCPRMHASEIAGWPVTMKEMDFYYKLAENVMNVTNDFTKGSSFTQILLHRLQANGFPESTVEPIAIDLESTTYGLVRSNAFFSSITFIAQALNRPFDLAVNARALQVLTEKDKVVGVKVMSPEKKPYFLKAKNVVLSASTFQTPRILLHSGIQGSAIGHYLTNHSAVTGIGKVDRSEFPEILGPLRILIPSKEERPYQIHILGRGNNFWNQYKEQPLQEELDVQFTALGKIEAQFNNKVFLDPYKRDEYEVPEIQVHFTYSKQDEAVIQQMAEGVKQASSATKAPLFSTDGRAPIYSGPLGGDHAMGTCSMGVDPLTSATNSYGQIHGVQGLFVADNSVIPTSGTANPTLTTVALAIRTADYIFEKLK